MMQSSSTSLAMPTEESADWSSTVTDESWLLRFKALPSLYQMLLDVIEHEDDCEEKTRIFKSHLSSLRRCILSIAPAAHSSRVASLLSQHQHPNQPPADSINFIIQHKRQQHHTMIANVNQCVGNLLIFNNDAISTLLTNFASSQAIHDAKQLTNEADKIRHYTAQQPSLSQLNHHLLSKSQSQKVPLPTKASSFLSSSSLLKQVLSKSASTHSLQNSLSILRASVSSHSLNQSSSSRHSLLLNHSLSDGRRSHSLSCITSNTLQLKDSKSSHSLSSMESGELAKPSPPLLPLPMLTPRQVPSLLLRADVSHWSPGIYRGGSRGRGRGVDDGRGFMVDARGSGRGRGYDRGKWRGRGIGRGL